MLRWQILIAAAAMAVGTAAPAGAQDARYRRFTDSISDTNRSDRIVYVPLGWAFPGPRPATMPHDVSAAAWYRQPLGTRGARPDSVLDDAEFRLESFETTGAGPAPGRTFRVVVVRRPAVSEGTAAPLLRVVDSDSQIGSAALGAAEPVPGGTRFTFTLRPPHYGLARSGKLPDSDRFELLFMPARGVKKPEYITLKPTFGGDNPRDRMNLPPPRPPLVERVAGKREEVRNK